MDACAAAEHHMCDWTTWGHIRTDTKCDSLAKLPACFGGGGQLRNDVNSTNLHVFFSHCEKQAPLPSSSNTHTLSAPSVIKKNKINHKCTTKAEQALQECDDIQHGCIMCLWQRHGPSVSEEGVQRACRTLPPVDGAGITTTAPDDSAVRKQTP